MELEIVIATPNSKESFVKSECYKCLEQLKDKCKISVIFDNRKGLSEIYNHFIIESNRNKIILFIHDDVLLEDSMLLSKLEEAHKLYDIVGLAGTTTYQVKSPCLWHVMPTTELGKRWSNNGDLRGFVSHIHPNGQSSSSFFGVSPSEVKLIDGLFISVNVNSLLDKNVKFDDDFSFHFYDLAFSIRADRAGLKLGVYPIFVRHYGLGHTDSVWNDLEPIFISKYS